MKKLYLLFAILFFISCTPDDNNPEGNPILVNPSDFGKITTVPDAFFDKVNQDVGKWNVGSNISSDKIDRKSKKSFSHIASHPKRATLQKSKFIEDDNSVYINEEMAILLTQINDLINNELEVFNQIEGYMDDYYSQLSNENFEYDATNYNLVRDSLFVQAEDYHNQAIAKRNDAVGISSEAIGESAYEIANGYIDQIATKINEAVPVSMDRLVQFFTFTQMLYNEYEVEFEESVIAEVNVFLAVPEKIDPLNTELYTLLFDHVYPNLLGSEWINAYSEITNDFTTETYTTKIELFENKLNEIDTGLELFANFYSEATAIKIQFDEALVTLDYESAKNYAKMIFSNTNTEIGGRYTEMNAWKLALLYEYLDTKVEYLVNVGAFAQEYSEIFNTNSGYNRLPCLLFEIIVGLNPIEAEANERYPNFGYLGISYENWPAYDEQFQYQYDFDAMRASIQSEMEIRINEEGCDCFSELEFDEAVSFPASCD